MERRVIERISEKQADRQTAAGRSSERPSERRVLEMTAETLYRSSHRYSRREQVFSRKAGETPSSSGGLEKASPAMSGPESSQLRAFTMWWDSYLAPRGYPVTNLREQIKDGVLLLRLLEALEGVPPSPVARGKIMMSLGQQQMGLQMSARPQSQSQRLENLNLCLQYLKAPPPHGRNLRLANLRAAS